MFFDIDEMYDCEFSCFKKNKGNTVFSDKKNQNLERANYLSLKYYSDDVIFNYIKSRAQEPYIIIKSMDKILDYQLKDFMCVKYNYFKIENDAYEKYYNKEFNVEIVNSKNIHILGELILKSTHDERIKNRILDAILKTYDLTYFVIFYKRKPIGYVSLYNYYEYGKIEDLYILEEHRGLNASKHLLSAIIMSSSATTFYVLSTLDEYYRHIGFLHEGEVYFYFKYFVV